MLWRSKSNKNRTAHAGVEPAGDSGQQPDTAKPAPQAEQVVPQPGAQRHHTVDDALKQASRPTRKEMLAQMAESEEGRAMLKKLQGLLAAWIP